MKPEFDKEIDSLLRRNARLAAAGPQSAGAVRSPLETSHLDADELSAFAENALPAAARARYSSHLADCDECRKMAVQLSSAADVTSEIEKRAAAAPVAAARAAWWQKFFGAVFAPRVLRYATPVLVLGLVGVVSFIALRSRQGRVPDTAYRTEEAARTNIATAPESDAKTTATDALSPSNASSGETSVGTGKASAPAAVKSGDASGEPTAGAKTADKDAALADRPEPVMAKKEGPSVAGGGAESKEKADVVASAPVAAPPPAKAPAETTEPKKGGREDAARNNAAEEEITLSERGQQAEQNRAMNQKRGLEAQTPDGSMRNESRAMNNSGNVGSVSQTAPRSSRSAMKRGRSDDSARDAGEDDEATAADTRSVAGHRFRRQGGAWVDVNYKSSMSMTGVRRGTDSYRALVADIPELGRIAEHLGGEVIVVVKGRAYRIR